jgi:parvulin-like peptidyl-prolyl isomerase
VRAYYDDNVAVQELAERSDPELAAETYLSGGYDVSLYVPESLRGKAKMIKHVLVQIPDDEYMQILTAQQEGDDELADQIRQEALTAVYPRAQEVIEKRDSGEDFETLIAEYNDDPGMESNPDGYLVYEGSSFVESFIAEAMRLENVGDTSTAPVESFYGYHILQYASDPVAGPVPLDDVSDSIRTVLASRNQSVYWQDALQAMRDQADIVEYAF